MDKVRVKIVLDRGTCIDCASCVPEDDEHFVENEKREIHIKNADTRVGEKEESICELSETQVDKAKSAASVCPVEAISVIDL